MTNVERMIQTLKASAQNSEPSTQADTELGEVIIGDALLNDTVQINTPGTPSSTDYIWGVSEPADGGKPTVKKFTPAELVDAVNSDVSQIKSDIEEMKTSVEGTKQDIEESATEISSAITTGISGIEQAADTGVTEIGTAKESALDAIGESDSEGARKNALDAINSAKTSALDAIGESDTEGARGDAITAINSSKTSAENAIDEAKSCAVSDITEEKEDAVNALEQKATELSVAPMLPYPSFHVKYNQDGTALVRLSNDYAGLEGIDMRYTIDGTVPAADSSVFPSDGLVVSWNCTVKVRAFPPASSTELQPSVTNSTFVEDLAADAPFAPILSIQVGTAIDNCKVSITNFSEIDGMDGTVRYRTDGNEPGATDPAADSEIVIDDNVTLKAKAFYAGGPSSDVASVTIDDLKVQAPALSIESNVPSDGGDIEVEPPVNLFYGLPYKGNETGGVGITGSEENIIYQSAGNEEVTITDNSIYGLPVVNTTIANGNYDYYMFVGIISYYPPDLSHKYYLGLDCNKNDNNIMLQSSMIESPVFFALLKNGSRYSFIAEGNLLHGDGTTAATLLQGVLCNMEDITYTDLKVNHPILVDITANQELFTSLGLTTDEEIQAYLDGIPYEDFASPESSVSLLSAEGTTLPDNLCEGMTYVTSSGSISNTVPACLNGDADNLLQEGSIVLVEDITFDGNIRGEQIDLSDYRGIILTGLYIGLGAEAKAAISQHKAYIRFSSNMKPGEYYFLTGLHESTAEPPISDMLALKQRDNVASAIVTTPLSSTSDSSFFAIEGYSRILQPKTATAPTAITDILKSGETTLIFKDLVVVDIEANSSFFSSIGLETDAEIREYLDSLSFDDFGAELPDMTGIPVQVSCPTAGAYIHYTTDGTTPTEDSQRFMGALSVTPPVTLKAIAVKGNLIDSDVTSLEVEEMELCPAPVISFDSTTKTVTITCEIEADIYYEIDGSSPTTSSTLYSDPFTIEATTTVKAFAVADGYLNSTLTTQECLIAPAFVPVNLIGNLPYNGISTASVGITGTKENNIYSALPMVIDAQIPTEGYEAYEGFEPGATYYLQPAWSSVIYNALDKTHKYYISSDSDISDGFDIARIISNGNGAVMLSKSGNRFSKIHDNIADLIGDAGNGNEAFYPVYYIVKKGETFTPFTEDTFKAYNPIVVDITANASEFAALGLTTDEEIQAYLDGIAYEDFLTTPPPSQ